MTTRELREALAEGLHAAMCYGPTTLHNRLACERPWIYLNLADAALNHPAMREIVEVQRRSTDAAFGALSAVSDDLDAALAIDAATDEAERVWSQKLPDGVPKG